MPSRSWGRCRLWRRPIRARGSNPRICKPIQVVLNWYPKIQALRSSGVGAVEEDRQPDQGVLTQQHIAFLDLDALYFELQRFKAERAWHNLNLPRNVLRDLLADQSWYRLMIPESELAFDSFEKVHLWQELAEALLKKYCERYYSFRKKEWELPHLEYRNLDTERPNFPRSMTTTRKGIIASWWRSRRRRLSPSSRSSKLRSMLAS